MNKRSERQIRIFIRELFKKIYSKSRIDSLLKNDRQSIEKFIATISETKSYQQQAQKLAIQITNAGLNAKTGEWRKFYEIAKKNHVVGLPTTFHQYEMNVYSKAVKQNFTMIKSIPSKMMEMMNHKYTSTLIEQVVKNNLPRGAFEKELAKHGAKHAKLIARTEAAKLQTAITELRATDLGSVAYEWVASHDKRTRPSHKMMNGVIVFWQDNLHKPLLDGMRGNAGEFPNCRCDASPLFDESDLTKSNYQVYDYRTDKIITLSRKNLITALQRKGLAKEK